MNKKQFLSLSLAALLTLSIAGCSNDNEKNEQTVESEIVEVKEAPSVEVSNIFEPHTHIIRYYTQISYEDIDYGFDSVEPYDKKNNSFVGPNVNIPDGYELYDIIPIIEKYGYGSFTNGFLYIFTNEVPVEAKGNYNENGELEFLNPGTPLELKEDNSLKLEK